MGKRIISLQEAQSITNDDYLVIDNQSGGTKKVSAGFINDIVSDVEVDGTSVVNNGVAEIDLSGKQDTIVAGSNITIAADGKTISATDTTYTAGTNVQINNGVISATDTTYTAGTNVQIESGVISATDTTYTAGTNVQIDNGVISATDTTYTAGTNVDITNGVISATDTTYTAGTGIDITNGVISSNVTPGSTVTITPTLATGTKVADYSINGVNGELYAPSGGGGGSTVTVTQKTSTGTNIADITVDGVTTQLYAPNGGGGASAMSDLMDVNLTSLANGQILKYDSTSQKWINSDESGGGTGGTMDTLWEGSVAPTTASPVTVNLNGVISDYDMIIVNTVNTNEGTKYSCTFSKLAVNDSGLLIIDDANHTCCVFIVTSNTSMSLTNFSSQWGSSTTYTGIYGVRFGAGGGGGNLSYETVFSGSKSTSAWNSPLVFNEFDVTACDIIRITAAHDSYSYTWLIDTSLIPLTGGNMLHIYGEVYCDRDDTELQMYVSTGHTLEVSKIESVISGGGGGSSADEVTLQEYNALTTAQKNDGTIRFIPQNPYGIITDVDMSTITNLSDSAITVTPSADEIEMDFDHNDSYRIGGTFYISAPINVTNYDYLKYDLTTGVCYNSLHSDTNPLRNLGIGLCRNAPSTWQYCPNVNWAVSKIYDVNDVNSTFTDEVIDVSELTGTYYFVVAFVAWEATISNLKFATAGGYPSQIKYMDKTYGISSGGEGYTEETLYSVSSPTVAPNTLTLSNSYTDYDILAFDLLRSADSTWYHYETLIPTSNISIGDDIQLTTYYGAWASYDITNATTLTLINSDLMYINSVKGLKFGSGGGGDSTAAEEMTLDEYNELTEQQKNDGTIRFIPYSTDTDTPFDMSSIANPGIQGSMSNTTTSTTTNIIWNGDSAIADTLYYTNQIDVTNADKIVFDLTTGSHYPDSRPSWRIQIGLMSTAPTNYLDVSITDSRWLVAKDYYLTNSSYPSQELDVSQLTGSYYLVINAHGWNATFENIALRQLTGSPSQIKYMSKTYADNQVNYSTTEHQVGTWIDGSDVYEKTIPISNVSLSSGSYEIVDTITGLDTIISCNGYAVEGNLKYTLNDITLRVIQDGASVKLYSPSGTTWTISSGAIIIRYIKVTAS